MEKQDPFHPFDICHKVFKFFTKLFPPRHRADKSVPHQTVQDRSAESPLPVHFKPFEDQDLVSSSIIPVASEPSNTDPNQTQVIKRRRGAKPTNKPTMKSGVGMKQSDENMTENGKISAIPIDTEKPKVKYQPHLISVAPNINEKSESFIRSRIEAMRKNLSSDSHDS